MGVKVLEISKDLTLAVYPGQEVVVDSSMIEEFKFHGQTYRVVKENYVLGGFEDIEI